MALTVADQTYVKRITDDIEAAYRALQASAATIQSLLDGGRATCKDVQQYNLMAAAVARAQNGMLIALRQSGESIANLPERVPLTLFAWRNVPADQMLDVDCAQLGATSEPRLVSSADVQVITNTPAAYQVMNRAPNLDQLAGPGLGGPLAIGWIWVVGAAIVATAAVTISIFQWLKESRLAEETTSQVRLQAEAHLATVKARLTCYEQCTASGGNAAACSASCAKLVPEPDIRFPSGGWPFGLFGTALIIAGVGAAGLWWYRRQRREPLGDAPTLVDAPPAGARWVASTAV